MNTIWFSPGSSDDFMNRVLKLEHEFRDHEKTKSYYLTIAELAKAVYTVNESGNIVFTEVGI